MPQVSKVQGSAPQPKMQTITLKKGHQLIFEEKDLNDECWGCSTKGKMVVYDDNGTPNNEKDDKILKEYNLSRGTLIPIDIDYYNHRDGHIKIGDTIFKKQDKKAPISAETYEALKMEAGCKCASPHWFTDLNEKK